MPGGLGYSGLIEPNWIDVDHHRVQLGSVPLPSPVRILHISDLHLSASVPLSLIDRAIRLGLDEKPDVICMTGDFITDTLEDEATYARTLRAMADMAPTFAVTGNHDGGHWSGRHGGYRDCSHVLALAEAAGMSALHNHTATVTVRGSRIDFTGVADLWSGEFLPGQAFAGIDRGAHGRVLLCHNPDGKEHVRDLPWQLMLSGHTHGGQVALPLLGGGFFAPVQDTRYVEGLKPWNGRQIHVSRGVGSILGIRFNCRPQVSLLELV